MHLFDVIVGPLLTEKASLEAQAIDIRRGRELASKYTFRVHPDANKIQVKKAIEALYGVAVTGVNTSNFVGKLKGSWRRKGARPDWKKAVVTLKKGERIPDLYETL